MKLHQYLLTGWLLLAGLTSCQTPVDPASPIPVDPIPGLPQPPPVDAAGLVCPVGDPTGMPLVSATIGPAGGTLTSEDGSVRIWIPAGALAGEETVQIVPISNTNPAGKGTGYRLEPHGTSFAKPVKLTFTYQEADLEASLAEALQIACQNEQGAWMAMPGVVLDKQARTITVETTHFSDWTYFTSVVLTPQRCGVRPGERLSMAVRTTLITDELLAPLVKIEPLVRLHADQTVPVLAWAIPKGVGQLATTGASPTNTYTAPTGVVSPTPVTVTAQIRPKGKGMLLLLASLLVMPEGIAYRLDGGPWVHRSGTAFRAGGRAITIGGGRPAGDTNMTVGINIDCADGSSSLNLPWANNTLLTATDDPSALFYRNYYQVGQSARMSPGGVYLHDIRYTPDSQGLTEVMSMHGGYTVAMAGAFTPSGYAGTHHLEGYFSYGNVNQ